MTTNQHLVSQNFYKYVAKNKPIKAWPKCSENYMSCIQERIYKNLYNFWNKKTLKKEHPFLKTTYFKKEHPFLKTIYSKFRTTTKIPPNHLVYQIVDEIEQCEKWQDFVFLLSKLHAYGVKCLFEIDYDPNLNDSSTNILYFKSILETYLIIDSRYKHNDIETIVKSLNIKNGKTIDFKALMSFENKVIHKHLPSVYDQINTKKSFNIIKSHQNEMIQEYLSRGYLKGVTHFISFLSVDNVEYFLWLKDLFQDKNYYQNWKQYFTYHWLRHISVLYKNTFPFHSNYFDDEKNHKIALASFAWWKDASECFLWSSNIQKLKKKEILIKQMINMLRQALKKMFLSSSLSEKTKNYAIRKLKKMKFLIGWGNFGRTLEQKENNYEYFDDCILKGYKNKLKEIFLYVGKKVNKTEWRYVPMTTVNAYYSRELNTVYLPISLWENPYLYDSEFSDIAKMTTNFACFGSIIAHEMCHGFDFQSRHLDAEGNLCNWWDSKDDLEYEKNVKKMINLFNVNNNNGKLTISENISDVLALQITFSAFLKYLKKYKIRDQKLKAKYIDKFFKMFAISQYDPEEDREEEEDDDDVNMYKSYHHHSLSKLRVNIPLSIYQTFLEFYKIKPNKKKVKSSMYIPKSKRPNFFGSK